MPHKEYNLFESVIHITEERDRHSLEKALIETLSDFIDFDSLVFLRKPRNTNNEYLEVSESIPQDVYLDKFVLIEHEHGNPRVEWDNDIRQCIEHSEVVSSEKSQTQRILFPIVVNNVVTGVLDLYGYVSTENTNKLVNGFLRIYSNFLAIISDNEHDTLTGLLNRKTFDVQLSGLLSSTLEETDTSPSIINERRNNKNDTGHWIGILDIDHFKSINDNFGHMYGDEVLLLFANLMENSFRSSDLLFRYGGEEFVVVLASTTKSDAMKVFDLFRQRLEVFDFPQVGRVTVSIGLVKLDAQEHPTTLLECADRALYYAKEHGRNQVCNYHDLIESGELQARTIETDIDLF